MCYVYIHTCNRNESLIKKIKSKSTKFVQICETLCINSDDDSHGFNLKDGKCIFENNDLHVFFSRTKKFTSNKFSN